MIHQNRWELAHAPNPVGLTPERRSVTFEVSDEVVDRLLEDWSEPVQLKLEYHAASDTYDLVCRSYPRTGTYFVDAEPAAVMVARDLTDEEADVLRRKWLEEHGRA